MYFDQFGEKNISSTNTNREVSCSALMMNNITTNNNITLPLNAGAGTGNQMVNVTTLNMPPQGSVTNGNYIKHFYNEESSNITSSTMMTRTKIMAHPLFSRLLTAYVNCHKVGAPQEVVARLEEACSYNYNNISSNGSGGCIGDDGDQDAALDQFMEAYCEMLAKYEQELTKPFKEAMLFLSRVECEIKALTPSSSTTDSAFGDLAGQDGSSKEEVGVNDSFVDPEAKELKAQLLRKYGGYLGSLKQEFLKKKKNEKLPKESRQQLLEWWNRHYKWPYPSEAQKLALAETTGLDLKQINNWFINQRKRHWKSSEDKQLVMMDAACPSHHYNMDNIMYNPFSMDCSSTLL